MDTIANFVLKHRRAVLLFWLIAMLIGFATSGKTTGRLTTDFSIPSEPGFATALQVERTFGSGGLGNSAVVLVKAPAGQSVRGSAAAESFFKNLGKQFPMTRIVDPITASAGGGKGFISKDGSAAIGLVYLPQPKAGGFVDALDKDVETYVEKHSSLGGGFSAKSTGYDQLESSSGGGGGSGLLAEVLFGGLGALIVLGFVFASFLAFLPIAVAIVSIPTTFAVLLPLTYITPVNMVAEFLVGLIGLGVAIDYSLLVVTRWREERDKGRTNDEPCRAGGDDGQESGLLVARDGLLEQLGSAAQGGERRLELVGDAGGEGGDVARAGVERARHLDECRGQVGDLPRAGPREGGERAAVGGGPGLGDDAREGPRDQAGEERRQGDPGSEQHGPQRGQLPPLAPGGLTEVARGPRHHGRAGNAGRPLDRQRDEHTQAGRARNAARDARRRLAPAHRGRDRRTGEHLGHLLPRGKAQADIVAGARDDDAPCIDQAQGGERHGLGLPQHGCERSADLGCQRVGEPPARGRGRGRQHRVVREVEPGDAGRGRAPLRQGASAWAVAWRRACDAAAPPGRPRPGRLPAPPAPPPSAGPGRSRRGEGSRGRSAAGRARRGCSRGGACRAAAGLDAWPEAVTEAGQGLDRLRARGGELGPDAADVAVDGAVADHPARGVGTVHQLVAGEDAARPGQEGAQDPKLGRSEDELGGVPCDAQGFEVDVEQAVRQRAWGQDKVG